LSGEGTLRIERPLPRAKAAAVSLMLEDVERSHILRVLEQAGWRIRGTEGAAEGLGLPPTTLEARMTKLGIRRPSRPPKCRRRLQHFGGAGSTHARSACPVTGKYSAWASSAATRAPEAGHHS